MTDPDIQKYIKEQLDAGYTPEDIEQALVKAGHDPNTAKTAIDELTKSSAATPAVKPTQSIQAKKLHSQNIFLATANPLIIIKSQHPQRRQGVIQWE